MKLDIEQMAPPSGRRRTLVKALEYLAQHAADPPVIVEIGTIRDARPTAQYKDGWATYVFGWYASETSGRVITIDADPLAVETCKRVTADYWRWITYHLSTPERDTREILSRMSATIDLLYLDGPHGTPEEYESSATLHLEWYRATRHQPRMVLIDDAREGQVGVNGKLVVPQAIEDGYQILFHEDQQLALVRE